MIYTIPTKKGLGVEIWGTYDDMSNVYNVISKFWNQENQLNHKGSENRDKLISSFSYEIRKAKDGSRLTRKANHFTFTEQEYFGTKISWVHFLFSLTALKHNMRFYETNKLDIAMILQIEFWLEKSMNAYDEVGAKNLAGFIEDGLYGANNYSYQYMRSINLDFFQLGGGKRSFRKLPELLKRGIFFTEEYKEYENFLKKEAQRINCDVGDLEIDDDHFDYEKVTW